MNLAKLLRQYLAERPKGAFSADQLVRLLKSSGLVDEEPSLERVFAAIKTLNRQGHLYARVDTDSEATLYQITPDGIAKYRASP